MKIFLTGASGNVGGEILEHFLNLNFSITCGLRNIDSIPDNASLRKIRFDLGKLTPDGVLIEALGDCDAVIHCGAKIPSKSEDQTKNLDKYLQNNSESTRQLLQLASNHGVKNFIYISAINSVYSNPFPITENNKYNPHNSYILSKILGELYCIYYNILLNGPQCQAINLL